MNVWPSSRLPSLPDFEFDRVTPCGRVLLWLGILRSLRLKEILDSHVRSECEVSHGTVIEALVLNRLISPRPLSRIETWAEGAYPRRTFTQCWWPQQSA